MSNYINSVKKEHYYRHSGSELNLQIIPFFENFHKLSTIGNYEYPLHVHTSYELIIITDMEYRCTLNAKELKISKGKFLLIKPGDSHQDHFENGQHHYVIHFLVNSKLSGKNSNVNIFREGILQFQQIGKFDEEMAGVILKDLESESIEPDIFSSYIQDSLLQLLFWKIIQELSKNVLSDELVGIAKYKDYELKLYRIFDKNIHRNLDVVELAKLMGMSKRSLSYFCKKIIGKSPHSSFISYKIEKICNILRTSDLSIKEVSSQFGFNNPFHFSRVFKKHVGVSPKYYQQGRDSL